MVVVHLVLFVMGSHVEPPQHALSHARPRRVQSDPPPWWSPPARMPWGVPGEYPRPLVGTEKRERQRAARLDKISTQATAAKRDKTRGPALRIAVAAVVVIAVLFGVSQLMAGDDDSSSDTETAADQRRPRRADRGDHARVLQPGPRRGGARREPPAPEPPPADTPADGPRPDHADRGRGRRCPARRRRDRPLRRRALRRHRVRPVVEPRRAVPGHRRRRRRHHGMGRGPRRREGRRAPTPRDRGRQRLRRLGPAADPGRTSPWRSTST